eukprot:1146196-Pelagomonas_calceolata.AAC.1
MGTAMAWSFCASLVPLCGSMATMGVDQPGRLADWLVAGLSQPEMNPEAQTPKRVSWGWPTARDTG